MNYMGGKSRISKQIIPLMLSMHYGEFYFYDLFCGGCNIIDKIPETYERYANDINKRTYLAMLMIKEHVNELPKNNKEFNEEDYHRVKVQEMTPFNCFVGYAYSFAGIYFKGWQKKRDFVEGSYKSAIKQSPKLQTVKFTNLSYEEVKIKPKSLIYCDPPYENTAQYKGIPRFDHKMFWEWCREKKEDGHTIFISEYNAPPDFECIWQREIHCNIGHGNGFHSTKIEKLFTLL